MLTVEPYTVLIVDDAPENIQVLSGILYQQGVKLTIAQNGKDALNAVTRKPPDLILLDILMPEMDGFAVCQSLKDDPATREIPIIFLTAKTQSEDIVKGFELGAVDYITKPVYPSELLSRVFTHLELKKSRDLITRQNQQLAEALHRNERQYRFLVENVTDGIGVIQQEQLIFVNHALADLFGFPADHLIGRALRDLVHQDHRDALEQIYERLKTGGAYAEWHILQYIVRGDGRELWIEGQYSTIEWEGQPAILLSMRDISHHKLREIEIEQEKTRLRTENLQLKSALKERYRFGEIIGKSPAMQAVYELIVNAAATDVNVLISGESGTGKDLIARTIHALSKRCDKPFVPVNCAAIPDELFESEFFGHRKGAFTGAYRDKDGFFDLARGGSLFLDEMEALSPAKQVKLLRALEGRGYTPVGGDTVRQPDVRIIAATNKDVAEQVKQGLMRDDFFYRMYVLAIPVPPLRNRREDIPLLIDHFLRQYGDDAQRPDLSGIMLQALYDYDWPGNVRELQNTIQRFIATKRLDFIGIPAEKNQVSTRNLVFEAGSFELDQQELPLQSAIEAFEKDFLTRKLAEHNWRRSQTAQDLHITERTLYRKIQQYQLGPQNTRKTRK
jgi:PAS domain S-box-containing protein